MTSNALGGMNIEFFPKRYYLTIALVILVNYDLLGRRDIVG